MTARVRVRQSVILAAGNGSRLSAARGNLPKPLIRVAGQALIDYALEQAVEAGVEEAVIVTGNAADQLQRHLAELSLPLRLSLVHNPRYHEPNGVSLLAAAERVQGPFFLQMADHLFARPVLSLLAQAEGGPGQSRLLVDRHPVGLDEADATKVRITGSGITAIGKDVYPYDAVDTGCFLLDPSVFGALRQVAEQEPPSVTLGMRALIAAGQLAAVPLAGVRWTDVDTVEDYARAELLLTSRRRLSGSRETSAAFV
jgi:choline kinase